MNAAPFLPLPFCLLFSEDAALCHRLSDLLRERAHVFTTPSVARLRSMVADGMVNPESGDPVLLFFDLRTPGALDLLPELTGPARTRVSTVALGRDGSTPFAHAEEGRLYRVVDLERAAGRHELAEVVEAALDRVSLQQENAALRAELARARAGAADPLAPALSSAPAATGLPAQQFVLPPRHGAGTMEALFESIVEGAGSALAVARIGVYHAPQEGDPFRLRAGRHCLDHGLEFAADDPLARWLERYRQPVSRRAVETLADPAGRLLLRRTLDFLGAETLAPLFVRGRLAGWVFTGAPFAGTAGGGLDFHALNALGEHASVALENHSLYEDAALRLGLVESVLGMLPASVIAMEPDGTVRWANARARALFPVLTEPRRGRPPPIIEDVSSRLAGLVHSALAGDPGGDGEPLVWELALTARTYSARAHAPRAATAAAGGGGGGQVLGVFVVMEDITEELRAQTGREVLARQALCSDLAGGLAHEIRNPLVTLKTFAQLLPQRYTDPEFRREFSALAEREVGRLDALLSKLEAFAVARRPPTRAPVNLIDVLRAAEDATKKLLPTADARFKLNPNARGDAGKAMLSNLPPVMGDAEALTRCFLNLFLNGVEAAMRRGVSPPVVTVDVVRYGEGSLGDFTHGRPRRGASSPGANPARYPLEASRGPNGKTAAATMLPEAGVRLAVADNGLGIAPELLPRVFSPFCTVKAQGLGLGLPQAQQIILEHGGRLELDAGSWGVCANVVLPLRGGT